MLSRVLSAGPLHPSGNGKGCRVWVLGDTFRQDRGSSVMMQSGASNPSRSGTGGEAMETKPNTADSKEDRVSGFAFRVSGFGFRVWGVGFRVSGLGFGVYYDVR